MARCQLVLSIAGQLTFWRTNEAQYADTRRPARDGAAGRIVAAIEDQTIGHLTPLALDQYLVVTVGETGMHRPAIRH